MTQEDRIKELEAKLLQREEELKFKQDLYDKALKAVDDGVWDWDVESMTVYYSPTWKNMLGYSIDEIENNFDAWERLLHPDDLQRSQKEAMRFASGEIDDYNIEFRMLAKDGEYKWIQSRAKIVELNDSGKPKRLIGIHTDITDEKNKSLSIDEAMHLAAIATWEWDTLNDVTTWQDTTYDIYGLDKRSDVNISVIESLIVEEDIPKHRDEVAKALETHQAFNFEYRINKAGEIRTILAIGYPIVQDGQAIKMVGIVQDITEIKEKDRILLEQSKALAEKTAILTKYIVYSRSDLDGVITDASDAFCEISGYTKEELIGNTHNIVRHPDNPDSLYENIWETITSGDTWIGEIKNKKKSGEHYWISASIAPEYDLEGKIKGYLSIRFDITATKELQLQQQIIHEQSKMAALGNMIGNIAHQWRQPLSVITTTASGISYKHEVGMFNDEEIPKNMELIVNHANYLSSTIDTFRNFLKEKKELKDVILQDRIKSALSIVDAGIKNNKIELIDKIDYSTPIKIALVVGELAEVIINIINNAKDALILNNIENPWVEINLLKEDSSIIITIEDNGGGISSDVMPKIFEPYYTTKHESIGTGLGLSMSYKIITESLNGKLYAKNTENGAKFFIELPLN